MSSFARIAALALPLTAAAAALPAGSAAAQEIVGEVVRISEPGPDAYLRRTSSAAPDGEDIGAGARLRAEDRLVIYHMYVTLRICDEERAERDARGGQLSMLLPADCDSGGRGSGDTTGGVLASIGDPGAVAAASIPAGDLLPGGVRVPAGIYTVQPGDTLSDIAGRYGSTVDALAAANPGGGSLHPGDMLVIPAGSDAVQLASIDPGAEPEPSAGSGASPQQAAIDDAPGPAPASDGPRLLWPVEAHAARVQGGAGTGDGIDFAVPEGTPVRAAAAGVVLYAADSGEGLGTIVLVSHPGGWVSIYGNLGTTKVRPGDPVRGGDEIALSGRSGSAAGPKLRFELRRGSAPVDPAPLLPGG